MTRALVLTASAVAALALAAPARAQGKGKHKSTPPSSTTLPNPAVPTSPIAGTVPFAWIDDASAGFGVTPRVSLFGSFSQSIATDADGAGRTVSGGVLILLNSAAAR